MSIRKLSSSTLALIKRGGSIGKSKGSLVVNEMSRLSDLFHSSSSNLSVADTDDKDGDLDDESSAQSTRSSSKKNRTVAPPSPLTSKVANLRDSARRKPTSVPSSPSGAKIAKISNRTPSKPALRRTDTWSDLKENSAILRNSPNASLSTSQTSVGKKRKAPPISLNKEAADSGLVTPRTSKRRKSGTEIWSSSARHSDRVATSLIDEAKSGYVYEYGKNHPDATTAIIYPELDVLSYNSHFLNKPHAVYGGRDKSGKVTFASILKSKDRDDSAHDIRAIIHYIEGDHYVSASTIRELRSSADSSFARKTTKEIIKMLLPDLSLVQIKSDELPKELAKLETRDSVKKYKIGMLLCKDGQTAENDIFANETSEQFETFLNLIGDKIELTNWPNYTGGLHTTAEKTGKHSLYTRWNGFEIMFHVSTLLPNNRDDPQRLERKRHIGNDVVVVVFVDGNTPFPANCLNSHFNHVFIIVRPEKTNGNTMYRVCVSCKEGVPPFTPDLPSPALFSAATLRDFLIPKMINGERSTLHGAPAFAPKLQKAREVFFDDFFTRFVESKHK